MFCLWIIASSLTRKILKQNMIHNEIKSTILPKSKRRQREPKLGESLCEVGHSRTKIKVQNQRNQNNNQYLVESFLGTRLVDLKIWDDETTSTSVCEIPKSIATFNPIQSAKASAMTSVAAHPLLPHRCSSFQSAPASPAKMSRYITVVLPSSATAFL